MVLLSPGKRMVESGPMLQLYLVLGVSLFYFVIIMIASHLTHALTLLVSSYQILCSVIALMGFILTIKNTSKGLIQPTEEDKNTKKLSNEELKALANEQNNPLGSLQAKGALTQLMNTFGWARVGLLFLLVGCVFLASLCFSVLVEALQTLVHISHHDEMHYPLPVLALGALGLLYNFFCYSLADGFMYQEGTILRLTESGEVVLENIAEKVEAKKNEKRQTFLTKKSPWLHVTRDNIGSVFVILCGALVYFSDENVAKYMDPILSLVSSLSLLALSFPYMKESCLILLQTIPNHIDIVSLKGKLMSSFPQIINVHDFHIWQLTEEKIILTVHIVFLQSKEYESVNQDITNFFLKNGITHTTIQPEFSSDSSKFNSLESSVDKCLVRCSAKDCIGAVCCAYDDSLEVITVAQNSRETLQVDGNIQTDGLEVVNASDEPVLPDDIVVERIERLSDITTKGNAN